MTRRMHGDRPNRLPNPTYTFTQLATDQRVLGPDGLFWLPASTGEQWCRTCPGIPHRVEHPGQLCPTCEGTEAPL